MIYSKPPLTEALIEIRTEPLQENSFEILERFDEFLKPQYPDVETRKQATGRFEFQETPIASVDMQLFSRLYKSEDKKQIVQVMPSGVSLSRLLPYESWNKFFPEFKRVWNIYRSNTKHSPVIRIGVRYINQISFDVERLELEHYLNIYPEIPRSLPSGLRDLAHYTMTLYIPQQDFGGLLVLNQGKLPSQNPRTIVILLDFDFIIENLKLENDEEIWSKLEQIRQRKNQYFEATITDQMREKIR